MVSGQRPSDLEGHGHHEVHEAKVDHPKNPIAIVAGADGR
jgi:hypothetical protein